MQLPRLRASGDHTSDFLGPAPARSTFSISFPEFPDQRSHHCINGCHSASPWPSVFPSPRGVPPGYIIDELRTTGARASDADGASSIVAATAHGQKGGTRQCTCCCRSQSNVTADAGERMDGRWAWRHVKNLVGGERSDTVWSRAHSLSVASWNLGWHTAGSHGRWGRRGGEVRGTAQLSAPVVDVRWKRKRKSEVEEKEKEGRQRGMKIVILPGNTGHVRRGRKLIFFYANFYHVL